jgi:hypothetical protein
MNDDSVFKVGDKVRTVRGEQLSDETATVHRVDRGRSGHVWLALTWPSGSETSIEVTSVVRVPEPSRAAVKRWMLLYMQSKAGDHLFDGKTGELNTTLLAENAAHAFDHDEWLDDETHYIWEVAFEVEVKSWTR